ncbi:MAG: BatA domain-containing protein [Verrucomicrobiota bacterium]
MSLLFPLYMFGAALIALPIYLHLRRKPPKDQVEFSSLMFLEPTKHQPLKRRSQLENWPLLLLRCLALLALAAVFARPFLTGGEHEGEEGALRTVVLLDTSASMRRDGVWKQATETAKELTGKVTNTGALAVIASDLSPKTVFTFNDWLDEAPARRNDLASEAIESLEPGWAGTDLGTALLAAAEMIADASADDEAALASEIVVISDLQTGADLDSVAGAAWPDDVTVRFVSLETEATTNASLSAAPAKDKNKIAVRVRNDPASERSSFSVSAGSTVQNAVVPAGESRVFEFEAGPDEIVLTGDDHAFDNTLFVAPKQPAPVDLLFLGKGDADDSNSPEYYFRRAFALSSVLRPNYVESLTDSPSIVAVARPLASDEITELKGAIENGARALLVLTGSDMARTFAGLAGMEEPPALNEREDGYALLEGIDFAHPSLREFRDPRWRDFTNVHFWKNREIDPEELPDGAQVVANFDSGNPAWINLPVGEGSLFVMASGWHPRDSQLALSSKFLPLLFSIFANVGPRVHMPERHFVGDRLPLEEGDVLAGGAPVIPNQPGVYQTEGNGVPRYFAVNLRPSESDLTPLSDEALGTLGIPLAGAADVPEALTSEEKRKLRGSESEAQQGYWRLVILILLGILALESWFASRRPEGNAPTPNLVPS